MPCFSIRIPRFLGMFNHNTSRYFFYMISYEPFWKTLDEKKISQYALINSYGLSRGTLDRIKQQKPLNLSSIEKLCTFLDCSVEKIVNVTPDPSLLKKID